LGISDKEIESMVLQAEGHAEADKARDELIEGAGT
jgi:molecular chaperone DnaK